MYRLKTVHYSSLKDGEQDEGFLKNKMVLLVVS